jgi:hypothetical protein
MKKWILRITLGLFALIIVAVIVLFLSLNTLVRWGVIRGGEHATGQNTSLSLANLSLSGGTLQLDGLEIDNLKDKGYSAPKILTMKSCSTKVQSSSVFSHTVVVDEINLDGLEVTLEQNGMKNNLNDLMEIIKKNTAATGDTQNASPGKDLKIGVIKITNSKVHLRANPLNMDIDLPALEMIDPMNPDGRPMKIADLVGKILLQLSKQIMENPQIPGNIKDAMKSVDALVKQLGPQLDKEMKIINKDLKGLQDATKNFKDPGKALQGLQDLIKKPDPGK